MKEPRYLTAEELIEYFLKTKDLSVEEIRKICEAWLKENIMDEWL